MSLSRRLMARMLEGADREISDEFMKVMGQIAAGADVRGVEEAIAAGHIEEAILAIQVDPAAWEALRELFRTYFRQGGLAEMAAHKPPANFVLRFAMSNPQAEAVARQLSSTLVREINNETMDAVRNFIGNAIDAGVNPRTAALDIVGVYDRTKEMRTGGVLGLTRAQEQWVSNAAEELGQVPPSGKYLGRRLRDRRFDGTVRKAIRDGVAIDPRKRRLMIRRYRAKALKYRGDTIGRTESIASLNAGRYQAVEQMMDAGVTTKDLVGLSWGATLDHRVRDPHRMMNGQTRRYGNPFLSPTGAMLRYPGDISLGAQGEDVINCRCFLSIDIDWIRDYQRAAA